MRQPKFAIIGLGFISTRHLKAIADVDGEVVVGCDIDPEKKHKLPNGAKFVKDYKKIKDYNVDYVVICTPNYLHYEMCKFFDDKRVICEKPLVIDINQIDKLDGIINVVHQLRYDTELKELKEKISRTCFYKTNLVIDIHRGGWYWDSWKGFEEKSGGLLFNIGIHYIDLLVWLFGDIVKSKVLSSKQGEMSLRLYFKNARVNFLLSVNAKMDNQRRMLTINGKNYNLSRNFEHLHTEVYKKIVLWDKGLKVSEIAPTLKLVQQLKDQLCDYKFNEPTYLNIKD